MMTLSSNLKRLILGGVVVVVLVALLVLDLANQGLAWRLFWSLTGEEQPIAQVRGMVEWVGNFTRQQPDTRPDTPIQYADVNPFGINTFLEQEVELAKREQQVQMIAEAGFKWIRQEFPWEDIEIHGRGDFTDHRNDHDGDGQIDAIDAWAKYDHIVDLVAAYGLNVQVRLSNPPDWTHSDLGVGDKAPPDDIQDYVNFAAAVAERYKGRVHYYQIWNEPNIYPEWGEQAVDPERYTELLCRTQAVIKSIDPEIVIISGALAPTISLTGRDLNDFIFLQRMYDAGAGACFDVLSMQGYGLNSGPTDHRMRPTTVNYGRSSYIRDVMVANDDAHKAIWISEAAWNPVDAPDVPADVEARDNYGRVTQAQAARYMPLAYQRAQEEWPWVGVVNYWFFKRAADFERNQSFYYFRMVEPDFTPLPIYDSMRWYIEEQRPSLYAGVNQAEHWAIGYDANAQLIDDDSAQFGQAMSAQSARFAAYGTDVMIRWRGAGALVITVGGIAATPDAVPDEWTVVGIAATYEVMSDGWQEIRIARSLLPQSHGIEIQTDGEFVLDAVRVANRAVENLAPYAAVVAISILVVVMMLVNVLRERKRT